jgi:hypothetical protein
MVLNFKSKNHFKGKNIIFFLLCFFVIMASTGNNTENLSISNTTINWIHSPTIVISTESDSSSRDPAMAIDSKNNIHMVWSDFSNVSNSGTDNDIFYKVWNATTDQWGSTIVVSETDTPNSWAPAIAIDFNDNVHIVWDDSTNYTASGTDRDIFYRMWNSSSDIWSNMTVLSNESSENSLNVDIAVDSKNNLHVVWNDLTNYLGAGTDNDIFYRFFNVSSNIWEDTEVVTVDSSDDSHFPKISVNKEDIVHIVWMEDISGSKNIYFTKWNETKNDWGNIETVWNVTTTVVSYPDMTIDSENNVHFTWQSDADYLSSGSDSDIFYRYYNNNNSTWSSIELVSTESTSRSDRPSIAVDTLNNIHIAWDDETEYASSGSDGDIFYKKKYSETNTWDTTQVVSTESTLLSRDVKIITDENNGVHIAWYDSTSYDNSGTDHDIFYKSSTISNIPTETVTVTTTTTDSQTEIETSQVNKTITQTNTETHTGPVETLTETISITIDQTTEVTTEINNLSVHFTSLMVTIGLVGFVLRLRNNKN